PQPRRQYDESGRQTQPPRTSSRPPTARAVLLLSDAMKKYKDIVGDGGSNVVAQVGEQQARLGRRLDAVRFVVAVVSGKGGVGKSTVTANLAASWASKGWRVGVLDADLNGPSMAKMLGVRGRPLAVAAAPADLPPSPPASRGCRWNCRLSPASGRLHGGRPR